MTSNYFSIERNNKCMEPVMLVDDSGCIMFENVMAMSYNELKSYEGIDEFVIAAMEAANELDDDVDVETVVTLVGSDKNFIWSIIIGPGAAEGDLSYLFVDWQKDGRHYRYAEE